MQFPFFSNYEIIKEWAAEARKNARACSTIAREKSANDFLRMIETSLSEGDGWLHNFARNENQVPATILIEAVEATADQPAVPRKYISNPNEILKHHAKTWSGHWKTDDLALCEETIRTIREHISQVESSPLSRNTYSPEAIRKAAGSFKRGTSTGTDNWMLAEITLMPDVVLRPLGELLADIQNDAVPPLQALSNIMATLPKKDGGTRTVAIATTIYRLLMQLDNEELEAFEADNAFANDSAKAGASAVIAAEDRALEAEIAHDEGYQTLTMLFDMKNFFESLDVATLFRMAKRCGFPS